MKKVVQFALEEEIEIPYGGKILSISVENGILLNVLVSEKSIHPPRKRKFVTMRDGESLKLPYNNTFLGSGGNVHIFEVND